MVAAGCSSTWALDPPSSSLLPWQCGQPHQPHELFLTNCMMGAGFFTKWKALLKSAFGSLGVILLHSSHCKMSLVTGKTGGPVILSGLRSSWCITYWRQILHQYHSLHSPKCPHPAAMGSARGRSSLIQHCCQTPHTVELQSKTYNI